MAANVSFDISTGVDLQEVDNAIQIARKEVATRYDFKGSRCTLDFDRSAGAILMEADDEFRLKTLLGVLQEKLVRRQVPVKNLDLGTVEAAGGGRARQSVGLKQGIDKDTARKISKDIKGQGYKKVQVQIQGEELRVISPSRDTLQEVIAYLRSQDYGMELSFGNYR